MPDYTVKDTQTGKTVTFRWNGAEPPTETDMAEVFSAARVSGGDKPATVTSDLWGRFKKSAYDSSPLPLFEARNLPGTAAAVAGAATGGLAAVPVAAATGMVVRGALGGTPAENVMEGAFQGAAQAVGPLVGAMGKAAPRLMQSALKPTQAMLAEYRTTAPKLVQTLLDEGINVTANGLAKLQGLFKATNEEIQSALTARDEALGTLGGETRVVDKRRVAARTLSTASRFSKQTNPTKDLQAIGETTQEFLDHPIYPDNLTLPEAQAMKQGTYREIGSKYGEVSSAGIEAQKALARGLKEEIAAEVPSIGALNARDSKLMAAMDAVGRRVALAGNRDPVGFAWVTHHPVTFLTALFDRSPAVKSLLARGLYDHAAKAARVSPTLIRAAVGSMVQDAPADGGTE